MVATWFEPSGTPAVPRIERFSAAHRRDHVQTSRGRRFLPLQKSIPSPDNFERVFANQDPVAFAQAFGLWTACESIGLVPVAIKGKSARAAKWNAEESLLAPAEEGMTSQVSAPPITAHEAIVRISVRCWACSWPGDAGRAPHRTRRPGE